MKRQRRQEGKLYLVRRIRPKINRLYLNQLARKTGGGTPVLKVWAVWSAVVTIEVSCKGVLQNLVEFPCQGLTFSLLFWLIYLL